LFAERNILVRNSLFPNVPTLISNGLQIGFWYDRPILSATNHKQRTTNLPTLPRTRSCECETSLHASPCVVARSPLPRMLLHLGQNSLFSTVPTLITSGLQM